MADNNNEKDPKKVTSASDTSESDASKGENSANSDTPKDAEKATTDAQKEAQSHSAKEETSDKPAPKKHKKRAMVVTIVVVVLVVAGVGFYQWHNTPQFCAAFCHNMDQYLATYEEPQNTQGVDKYGNEVSNTNAMMATLHRHNETTGKSEIRCMDCHHAIVGEQVSEGTEWISGNYYDPLDERVGDDLTKWWGEPGGNFCVNENCHAYLRDGNGGINYDRLEASTVWMDFNPHSQHHGDIQMACTECHKGHRASVYMCTGCHDDIDVPDGWVTYQENQEIMANSGTQLKGTQISESMVR